MRLRALIDGLNTLDLVRVQHDLLAAEAGAIAADIRAALGQPPGGPHDYPWRESGTLQASIVAEAAGLSAIVGSVDPVAVHQEFGTSTVPPRPFLAPLAEAHVEQTVDNIGAAVAHALRSL